MPDNLLMLISDKKEIAKEVENKLSGQEFHLIHCKSSEDYVSLSKEVNVKAIFFDYDIYESMLPLQFEKPLIAIFPDAIESIDPECFKIISAYLYRPINRKELLASIQLALGSAASKNAPDILGSNIREKEELLKALIESFPDFAYIIDEDGKYIKVFTGKVNSAYNPENRINKTFYDILSIEEAEQALEIVRKTIAGGDSLRFTYSVDTNGKKIWYEGVTCPMSFTTNGKKLVGWIARDISEHKKLENKLLEAKKIAERANQAKSEFLTNMSHEIRTPMNNIIGMTDLIIETTELDNEQEEYLEIIKSSSDHLLKIINDILNLSKIEAGKVNFEKKPFHLREAVEEIIHSVRPVADKKNLKVELNIDENIPEYLIGDEVHLKQILYNLTGNAIKYTNEGGCLVSVRRNKKFSDEGNILELKFVVEDTGVGIPSQMHESMFEAFSQAHRYNENKFESTGLGLSITKNIIEKLNGNLWFNSEENVGSTFCFILPFYLELDEDEAEFQADENKKNRSFDANKDSLRLLIAEDNDLNQKLILRLLNNRGHQTVIAGNGLEAIEKLRQQTFDAIFMDIQMPEMDGVEATRIIRRDRSGDFDPEIPIVAVTAFAFEEDKYKFFDAGMNEFIPKPISSRQLDQILQNLKQFKKEDIS